MTTAPIENRGGANGGPQYNPANVSATGGAGQSGTQAPKYISGGTYGQGQEMMAQQQGAPMAGPTPTGGASAMPSMPPIVGLNEPTQRPDEPVTTGADLGPGPDSSILNLPAMATPQTEQPIQMLQALYMQDPTNEDVRFILEGLSNQGRL